MTHFIQNCFFQLWHHFDTILTPWVNKRSCWMAPYTYMFEFWKWWNEKVARNINVYVPLKKQHGSKKRPWKRHSVCIYMNEKISICVQQWPNSRNRIVVSTSRCGRENPGSNPGYGMIIFFELKTFQNLCKEAVLTRFKLWLPILFFLPFLIILFK